jgi:hypothetical protein
MTHEIPSVDELPVGYVDTSGRIHRQFRLRKMTGSDEELLYESALNPGELVSALLASCVVRLGELEGVDRPLAAQLFVADRNYLLLQLRRLTLGSRLGTQYRCPACDAHVSVIEDLSRIAVRRLPGGEPAANTVVDLEDGYRDEQGRVHRRVVLTAPRGTDEEFVSSLASTKPLRARDALVLRCIRQFGDLSTAALDAYGVEILRSLTLGDRRRLVRALNEITLGPDFRRAIHCPRCAGEFEAVLDASSFFEDG